MPERHRRPPLDWRGRWGEHPDTGAEWAYSPTFDRMTLANGSNTRFANAGVARGVGMAFDPSIRLDRTRAA